MKIDWSPPSQSGDFRLASVSALAPDDIWAVGNASGPGMIAHRNATGWSYISWPPNLLNLQLSGVVAISTNDVWAVGSIPEPPFPQARTLTVHWNGRNWVQVATVRAIERSNEKLYAVDAYSSKDVWAVGAVKALSGPSAGIDQPLTLHWDGRYWAVVNTPGLAFEGALFGVTAISTRDVWAVGYFITGILPQSEALLARWNGTAWQQYRSPTFGKSPVVLWGVSASAANNVWAVGEEGYPNGRTLVLHWNGIGWKRIPTPATSARSVLHSVSCSGPDNCWAVGTEFVRGVQHGLVLKWEGGSWKRQPSRGPFARDLLQGVSTLSSGRAWAVGFHFDALWSGFTTPTVLRYP